MVKRSMFIFLATFLVASATAGFAQDWNHRQPTLTPQNSGTTQLLIAVSPVNSQVVWAAGTGGTYVVTTNGGQTWTSGVVPGTSQLQFRGVYAVSDKIAYLMSIGNDPTNFQIYKTVDGGANWTVEFTNQIEAAFLDCIAFWDPDRGVAQDDSVDGVFPDIRTENGRTWQYIADNMPPALPGEASFAASGTCITTQGENNAWATTGGSTIARVLATRDGGNTWNAYDTPLEVSPSGGGISVAFRDPWHGVVGGGDLSTNTNIDMAISDDGGQTWTLTNTPPLQGAIFCLAYVNGMRNHQFGWGNEYERTVVITAETEPNFDSGSAAWTPDEGQTWYTLPNVSGYWAVGFADPHDGWFVGNNGQILKISF
ncbi:MAG TPA: hypothetical protein VMD99_08810 [Terriglobales bacterium]|nr:hypothetical protein [Terriglobales bacterium]